MNYYQKYLKYKKKYLELKNQSGGNDEDFNLVKTFNYHSDYVISVAFSVDGKWMASGSRDKTIKLYDMTDNNGTFVKSFDDHSDWVNSVAFSPDGKWMASGSRDRTVKLYDMKTKTLVHHSHRCPHSHRPDHLHRYPYP